MKSRNLFIGKHVAALMLIGLTGLVLCHPIFAEDFIIAIIDYPGALGTIPSRINNSNIIVGSYADQAMVYHGFLYDGSWTTLDYPGAYQTLAYGINNSGKIVGIFTYNDGWGHGFLYDGSWTTINFPGAIQTVAMDINDAGVIVGYYDDANGTHGFIYDGTWTTLDFPGYSYTGANGINNSNKIVGGYGDVSHHGFLYDGSYHTIDYAGDTYLYGISTFDKIVGTYYNGMGSYIAFIYDGINFSTFSFSNSTVFRGINDAGNIVGQYSGPPGSGEGHGFVLIPFFAVGIDIFPGDGSNTLNLRRTKKISVAILSAPDVSTPTMVDQATLTFGRTGDEKSLSSCAKKPKDVDGDELKDLVCQFFTNLAGFQCGDTEGVLKGKTITGRSFEGRQTVVITPCR